jgi:hypothetical protein
LNNRVTIVAEDPGALAYLAGVPQAIRDFGFSAQVLACGHAARQGADVDDCVPVSDVDRVQAMVWSPPPAAIVVGTSENVDSVGHALTQAARKRGIVSVGLVDGPANVAHRFRGRTDAPLAYLPDWLAVPDDRTRERFVALGAPQDRVRACGHPGLDRIRRLRGRLTGEQRASLRSNLWPDSGGRPIVVFAAELSTGLDEVQFRRSDDYTLSGTSGSPLRTDVVIEEFLDAAGSLKPRPYLVLRLHPKTTRDMFGSYLGGFDACSETEPVIDVVQAADAIVGLTSIILDEALVIGRPVISIVPRPSERDWLTGAASGLTPVVSRREEIAPALRAAVEGRGVPDPATVDRLIPQGAAGNIAAMIADAIRTGSRH